MYLSLLAMNGNSSNGASTQMEREKEFENDKDVFEDELVLDFEM